MEADSKYIRSLLQSAQSGNNAALEQLIEMNLERIYALSHRLTSNQPDAEALATKTFIEAWKQLHKIRTDVPFSLWLESLNINLALQQLNTEGAKKKKWSLFKKKKFEVKEPDSKLSPLGKEICKLPTLERTIFVLNSLENYSIYDLTNMMNYSSEEIQERIESAKSILLKSEFFQDNEDLNKKLSELPQKLNADNKILSDAINKIYEIKLENRVEPQEEEEAPEVVQEEVENVEKEPEKIILIKESSLRISSIAQAFKSYTRWVVILIVIAAAIYFLITLGSKKWEINTISGNVILANEVLNGYSGFSADEILQTEEGASAKLLIPEVGEITVEQSSALKRLGEKNSAELIKGKIKLDFSSAKEIFTLKVPGAIVSDYYLGSFYTAEVTPEMSGKILINNGWLIVKRNEKEIIAPSNHVIGFNRTDGPQIPYNKKAKPELINAIEEFSASRSELHVERIVSLATDFEVITLWNLLKSISPGKRLLVYSKLHEIIPHPAGISKEDILNLDNEKLQVWLEEIELNM